MFSRPGHAGGHGWNASFTMGLALGGRPAASFAKRLMLPVTIRCFGLFDGGRRYEPIL
jgi:hypothetical protein